MQAIYVVILKRSKDGAFYTKSVKSIICCVLRFFQMSKVTVSIISITFMKEWTYFKEQLFSYMILVLFEAYQVTFVVIVLLTLEVPYFTLLIYNVSPNDTYRGSTLHVCYTWFTMFPLTRVTRNLHQTQPFKNLSWKFVSK